MLLWHPLDGGHKIVPGVNFYSLCSEFIVLLETLIRLDRSGPGSGWIGARSCSQSLIKRSFWKDLKWKRLKRRQKSNVSEIWRFQSKIEKGGNEDVCEKNRSPERGMIYKRIRNYGWISINEPVFKNKLQEFSFPSMTAYQNTTKITDP